MTQRSRRIFYFCPDFEPPSGGTKLLYRHVYQLRRMGFEAAIVHSTSGFVLTWHGYQVPVLSLQDNPSFSSDDIFVFPEGSVQFIINSQSWNLTRVVLALNWSYIHMNLPEGQDWRDFGIEHVVTPSPVIKAFVEWSMQMPVTLLDDYIDVERHAYQPEKKLNKLAYMPRKSDVGDTLVRILLRKRALAEAYDVSRLLNLTEEEYAQQLIESRIYLAVTSREGANISVLEAMSAGCLVIGFTGIGGRPFMVGQGPDQNCFLLENEDLQGLGETLEAVIASLAANPRCYDTVIRNGIATARRLGNANLEAESLKRYFEGLMRVT